MLGFDAIGRQPLGATGGRVPLNLTLTSAVGAFALTGMAAILTKAWKALSVIAGTYSLTGVVAHQLQSRVASHGTYSLTGQVAKQLISHVSSGGAYILTGFAAVLVKSQSLICGTGSFSLTGLTLRFVHSLRPGFDRIRQISAALYQIRTTTPELED